MAQHLPTSRSRPLTQAEQAEEFEQWNRQQARARAEYAKTLRHGGWSGLSVKCPCGRRRTTHRGGLCKACRRERGEGR